MGSMAENPDSIQRQLIASLDADRLEHFRADQMVYLRQRLMRLSGELDPKLDPRNAPLGPRIVDHLNVMLETAQTIALVDARLREPRRDACCEFGRRIECRCAEATSCPVHGEKHVGSHE